MNKLLLACLASASILCLSSCDTIDDNDHDDDDDDDHRHHHGSTTTTTTEETTLSRPGYISPGATTVETHTTRSY